MGLPYFSIIKFGITGIFSVLKLLLPFIKFKLARKTISTFTKIFNSQDYCTSIIDVVAEAELNAIDLLRKNKYGDFKSKGEEIHNAAKKVMGNAGILIGVAGNRQRKIAWLKNSYNFNDQVQCFKSMLKYIRYVDSIYRKPF